MSSIVVALVDVFDLPPLYFDHHCFQHDLFNNIRHYFDKGSQWSACQEADPPVWYPYAE
jgi:hypothetical protein